MPDLEKVIKGIEICLSFGLPDRCVECTYHRNGCDQKKEQDALELLRAARPEPPVHLKPKMKKSRYFTQPCCAECGQFFPTNQKPNYCSNCGRGVDWSDLH